MKVTIYGASDDLVELEGAFCEEMTALDVDDGGGYLAFSDGTVLCIRYTDEGLWRITPSAKGTAKMTKHEATDIDDDYSDRVTLEGEFKWVVWGSELTKPVK